MSRVSLFSEKSHDFIIGSAVCCNGIQDLFVSDLVTLFHELFEFFQRYLIFVLGFGYDFLLLLDLLLYGDASSCHNQDPFPEICYGSLLIPTICSRMLDAVMPKAFRISFCVAVTAWSRR